jgi:hypothetical protein
MIHPKRATLASSFELPREIAPGWSATLLLGITSRLPVIRSVEMFRALIQQGCGGLLLEFRGPVCQQSDGGGFGVVGGLDYKLFCVGVYVEADSGEVWQIELE